MHFNKQNQSMYSFIFQQGIILWASLIWSDICRPNQPIFSQKSNVNNSKGTAPIFFKFSVGVRLPKALRQDSSNVYGHATFLHMSAVCLQNRFLLIVWYPFIAKKCYARQNVQNFMPVVWYLYIFFICQLFVYL